MLKQMRYYDVSITYDAYYQTPHVYLCGFNHNGLYLTAGEMMEDVDEDYVLKTVTIDPHPFHLYSHDCISIHPCMHAATMERMLSMMEDGGKTAREDQYLFLFIKFIMSVVPSINFDYTTEINLPSNIVYYSKVSAKRNSTKDTAMQTASIVGESKPWKYKDAEITPLVRDLSIRSWEGTEKMIQHALQDWLCVSTEDNSVLLVEPPTVTHMRREKFAEMLFEKMRVPSLLMYKDAALTCFSRGRTMGMVVDIGEDLCRCCGVFDGFVDRDNVSYQRFAGARLRDLYVQRCLLPQLKGKEELLPRGCSSLSSSSRVLLYNALGREMNEKLSSVTENPYIEDGSSVAPVPFTLPDGKTIQVGSEAKSIPELLFFPTALGDPSLKSIQLMVADQLTACAAETTRDIASCVMLCGGVARMKGFGKRLDRELRVMSNGVLVLLRDEE
ncbi:hypothetical protein BLSTO_05375 [Blastocystis sp. subtype 1]